MTRLNTRSTQDRETKTRKNETREETDYTYEEPNATAIPEKIKQRFESEGLTLGWLRIDMKGKDDYINVGKKINQGWEFVTPEEVPEMSATSFVKKDGRYAGVISRGDVALGKIPTKKLEAKRAYYAQKSSDQIEAVNQQLMKSSNSRMPISNNSKSTVVKGRNPQFQG